MSEEAKLPEKLEWIAWLELPQSKMLRKFARAKIEYFKDNWASGKIPTQLANAEAIGAVRAYETIEELDFQDIMDVLREEGEE